MSASKKTSRKSEADIKLSIGDWLSHLGFMVYDEKVNSQRPNWGLFNVLKIQQGKRLDLIVCGHLSAAGDEVELVGELLNQSSLMKAKFLNLDSEERS